MNIPNAKFLAYFTSWMPGVYLWAEEVLKIKESKNFDYSVRNTVNDENLEINMVSDF